MPLYGHLSLAPRTCGKNLAKHSGHGISPSNYKAHNIERPCRTQLDLDPQAWTDQFSGFVNMERNTTAVCISRHMETWDIPELSFLCFTENWRPFGHEKSKDRIAYLAERRNSAVTKALSTFPLTQHILMIDSYYVHQRERVRKLVKEYFELSSSAGFESCIVGASTWILDKTKIRPRDRFYDYWTTPEGLNLNWKDVRKKGGVIQVRAVGGCYMYPRSVWERMSYGVPDDLHGCEHNWLCEKSALPVLLTLNVALWRDPIVYSWPRRLRSSLHLRRFLERPMSG